MELIVYKKSFVRNAMIGLDIYVRTVSKRVPKSQGQCTII